MLQFTPAYFVSDEPNLAKKNYSCERALKRKLCSSDTGFSSKGSATYAVFVVK